MNGSEPNRKVASATSLIARSCHRALANRAARSARRNHGTEELDLPAGRGGPAELLGVATRRGALRVGGEKPAYRLGEPFAAALLEEHARRGRGDELGGAADVARDHRRAA